MLSFLKPKQQKFFSADEEEKILNAIRKQKKKPAVKCGCILKTNAAL